MLSSPAGGNHILGHAIENECCFLMANPVGYWPREIGGIFRIENKELAIAAIHSDHGPSNKRSLTHSEFF